MKPLLMALLLAGCCPGLFCSKCAKNAAAPGCEGPPPKKVKAAIPYCGETPGDQWCIDYACAIYASEHHWKSHIGFDVWDPKGCMCQETSDSEVVYYWPFPRRFDAVDAPPHALICDEGPYRGER